MKNKAVVIFLAVILLTVFVASGIRQYRQQRPIISEKVPLIPTITSAQPKQTAINSPRLTNPLPSEEATPTSQISKEVSLVEKEKLIDYLPLHQSNFPTTANRRTVINIYSSFNDPEAVIRVEIGGIDYSVSDVNGPNAIAFRDSFVEARRQLITLGVDLRKIQILFGKHKFIQDTATFWVKSFGLLN